MVAREKLTTIVWHPTRDDGEPGLPQDVTMLEADVEAMRSRWREVVAMPKGDRRSTALRELRFLMDIFAAFPGTRLG